MRARKVSGAGWWPRIFVPRPPPASLLSCMSHTLLLLPCPPFGVESHTRGRSSARPPNHRRSVRINLKRGFRTYGRWKGAGASQLRRHSGCGGEGPPRAIHLDRGGAGMSSVQVRSLSVAKCWGHFFVPAEDGYPKGRLNIVRLLTCSGALTCSGSL